MKKLISFILSLTMICCVISVPASAVSTKAPITNYDSDTIAAESAGPWFGDVSEDFSIYVPSGEEKQFQARVSAVLMAAIGPFIPYPAIQSVCAVGATILSSVEDDQSSAHTYYVTIQKRYREIEVGGAFSHYETMVITTFYSDPGRTDYLTSDTQIFEGQMMMKANEEI